MHVHCVNATTIQGLLHYHVFAVAYVHVCTSNFTGFHESIFYHFLYWYLQPIARWLLCSIINVPLH